MHTHLLPLYGISKPDDNMYRLAQLLLADKRLAQLHVMCTFILLIITTLSRMKLPAFNDASALQPY